MPKGGLNWVDVSPDHFSSGVKKEPDFSRIVVRFFEGKNLLASDLETGKSDPVCFVWLGGKDETQPVWEKINDLNALENRVVLTAVSPTTCDPKWNQDLTFPLEVDDISQLANMKFVIYVRDEDLDENHKASYDELGMLELNLEDIIAESKGLQFSVMKSASWYSLKKSPGMRRVDGSIRIAISIIFAPNDIPKVTEQLASEIKDSPPNTPLGKLVLKKFSNGKFENSVLSKSSIFSATGGRPSSASSANKRKKMTTNRPTTAPMLKTSSFMSTTSDAIFEESDQILPHSTIAKDLHPELSVVREEDNDDLVSEPGYDRVISQIQQHGKKIEQIMDQPVIKEEEQEDIEEELHIIPNNSNPAPVQQEKPSSRVIEPSINEQDRTTIEQSHQDTINTKDSNFHHEMPKGDENVIQEVVKAGVDILTNALSNVDLPDGFDEHLFEVGKAAASAAKKSLSSMKVKASGGAVVSGVALRSYKDHVMNSVEKVQEKLSQLSGGGGGNERNRNLGADESNADIFANGPFLGDNLENPDLEEYDNVNPEMPLNGLKENIMNPETHREPFQNPQQLVRRQSSRQELAPQINAGEMQISEDAFQGNAAAVVRILKELHAQRQFMQNTVILLAKANEKGFKHLSGRISKMEKNLTLLNENIKVNDELDDFGFPMIGDQGAPEEFQPKYEEGMKVEVNYRGKGKYFVGKVVRYCGDGTYDIEFDDGDKELKVAEDLLRTSGAAENADESASAKKFSRTFPSKSRVKGKSNLSKTAPVPAGEPVKKNYSGFKEFRKQAKKAKNGQVTSYNDDFVVTKKATREPEIEFVYKGEKGEVAVAKVASGPVEFARQTPEVANNVESNTMRISDDPFALGPPVADQALPDSPNLRNSNPRGNQRYDRAYNRTSLQSSYANGGFKSPGAPSLSPSKSALNRDFCDVLDRGTIDDVAHLLESSGTQPEQLSISTRNRLYDVISTLLLQGRNIERCLAWTLALIRGKQHLLRELTIHSQKDLLESLKKVSKEPSKRGMLAHLLISQINRQLSN